MKGSTGVPGSAGVVIAGTNTVTLAAANTYTGGTVLVSGTLELVHQGSAGTGAVTFGAPGPIEILRLDYVKPGATNVSQPIRSLGAGASMIYLPDASHSGIVFGGYVHNDLTFKAGGVSYTLNNLTVAPGATINATGIVADKSGTGVDILATPINSANTIANITSESLSSGAGTQTMAFLPPNPVPAEGSGTGTAAGGSAAGNFILPPASGNMTIQDFSSANKGGSPTVGMALATSFSHASVNHAGTMLGIGPGQSNIGLVNHAAIAASNLNFV